MQTLKERSFPASPLEMSSYSLHVRRYPKPAILLTDSCHQYPPFRHWAAGLSYIGPAEGGVGGGGITPTPVISSLPGLLRYPRQTILLLFRSCLCRLLDYDVPLESVKTAQAPEARPQRKRCRVCMSSLVPSGCSVLLLDVKGEES